MVSDQKVDCYRLRYTGAGQVNPDSLSGYGEFSYLVSPISLTPSNLAKTIFYSKVNT